jgi:hypothetical protein
MGTRSGIIAKIGNSYQGIYCHWDGYPEGVGKTLKEHYTDPAKIAALIALGDISSLGERVAPKEGEAHSFASPGNGVTNSYRRDRGESGCEPRTGTLTKIKQDLVRYNAEYLYIWDGKKWKTY